MVLDWIYSPYCSSGWVAREIADVYDLKLREWNLAEIRDARLVMLPQHISKTVKEIRRERRYTRVNGGEPLYFLDQKWIGPHTRGETLSAEIEKTGIKPNRERNIPETFVHPRLDLNRTDTGVMIKAVTTRDIAGQGLPSPSRCIDARFGPLGSPEVVNFLSEMTRQYGRVMSIAFIGAEVAGYITHLPKPVCWRIGCSHVNNIKDMHVLQVIDFYVYPKFQDRDDVKETLLVHTRGFAKKSRLLKIEVFATTNKPKNAEFAPATGDVSAYMDFGFIKKKEILTPDDSGEDTEAGLGITQLMYTI